MGPTGLGKMILNVDKKVFLAPPLRRVSSKNAQALTICFGKAWNTQRMWLAEDTVQR